MRLVTGLGVGLLALGGFAWTSYAEISALSIDEGTIGDRIVVTGTDFGRKKPKVKFALSAVNPAAKGPKLKGKVVDFSDTSVTIEIKKADVGTYDMTIQPKGGDAQVLENAFRVAPPAPDSVNVESATRKGRFTITGTNFGSKKGKVSLLPSGGGAKRASTAKVKSWTNTAIEVEVGKKVTDGTYDVQVAGKAGSSSLLSGVRIFGDAPKPIPGKDAMTGKFGGTNFKAQKPISGALLPNPIGIPGEGVLIVGRSVKAGRSGSQALVVQVQTRFLQDIADLQLPARNTVATDSTLVVTFGKVTSTLANPIGDSQSYTSVDDPSFSVTITNVSGNRISGTFTGTLSRLTGSGPATIQVANGKFTSTLITN